MSRTKAKKDLSLLNQSIRMDGIVHGLSGNKQLDEAPGAYKDIETVMDNQNDLVDPIVTLQPLMNIKGD